jgi:hypothetical protein
MGDGGSMDNSVNTELMSPAAVTVVRGRGF